MINKFDNKLVEIPGYSFVRLDRNWSENGKLIKNSDIEMQWIEIKIKNMKRIILINVYRPPSGIYKHFCKKIYESISNTKIKDDTDIFIMGDMNIDMLNDNSLPKKELDNTMKRLGLININKNFTRYSKSKNSCIDLIFSNSDCIDFHGLLDWNISDHMGIFLTRKRKKIENVKITLKAGHTKIILKKIFNGQ